VSFDRRPARLLLDFPNGTYANHTQTLRISSRLTRFHHHCGCRCLHSGQLSAQDRRANIPDIVTGNWSGPHSGRQTAAHLTGIDISKGTLELASQVAKAESLRNAAFIKTDGGNLEFANDSFDVVTYAFGIFFLPESTLDSIYRVCKTG
jgi:hypothetical protein